MRFECEVSNIAKQIIARSYRSRARRHTKSRLRWLFSPEPPNSYNDPTATIRYKHAKPPNPNDHNS